MKKSFDTNNSEVAEIQVMDILRKAYLKMLKLENFDKYSFPFYLLRTAIVELYAKHDSDFASEKTFILSSPVKYKNNLFVSKRRSKV